MINMKYFHYKINKDLEPQLTIKFYLNYRYIWYGIIIYDDVQSKYLLGLNMPNDLEHLKELIDYISQELGELIIKNHTSDHFFMIEYRFELYHNILLDLL